jgi:Protein of unknown function (DUF4232)
MAGKPMACALALSSLVLVLVGCTTAQPTASRSRGSGIFTGGPAAASPTETPTPSESASDTATLRCHTVEITERKAPSADSSAGHVTRWLVITNLSLTESGTLSGFPAVSYVAGDKSLEPLNDPARHGAGPPSVVRLAPQKGAHVLVTTLPVDSFPVGTCKPVRVIGYAVSLPGESMPYIVVARDQQCSAKGVNVPEISPIQPGDL